MKLETDMIDYQEINDYKLLYKIFNDETYKSHYLKLENEAKNIVMDCINNSEKYVIVTNFNDDPKQTRYTTVINVEDKQASINKVFDIVNGIGKINSIQAVSPGVLVRVNEDITLIVTDFTMGVIE